MSDIFVVVLLLVVLYLWLILTVHMSMFCYFTFCKKNRNYGLKNFSWGNFFVYLFVVISLLV